MITFKVNTYLVGPESSRRLEIHRSVEIHDIFLSPAPLIISNYLERPFYLETIVNTLNNGTSRFFVVKSLTRKELFPVLRKLCKETHNNEVVATDRLNTLINKFNEEDYPLLLEITRWLTEGKATYIPFSILH